MQTLGQQLRAEREKKGLSIAELAGRTRFRALYFEAVEADRPEDFPGKFFYRSFLRQYAGLLDLPESVVRPEIERSMAEEQAETSERESALRDYKPDVPPLPTGRINLREETRRWMIRLAGLAGVIVLCSAVYFSWEKWGQRLLDEYWKSESARNAQPASRSQAVAQQPATPPASVAPVPATPDSTAPSASEPAGTAAQPANATAPQVDSPPPGVKPRGTIEVRASGDSWLSGWRDGKMFLAITLRAGDSRVIEGGGLVRLQFGSAGDVTIRVDGQTLPPIGARGEARTMEYHNGAYRLLDRGRASEQKPQ